MRPFRSPYPGRFMTAALQALHGFHGLRPKSPGSAPPCPPKGQRSRGGRIHITLRTGRSHTPKERLTLGSDTGRFPPAPPACYRASWQLPGPDLPRQANASLCSDQVTTRHHLRTLGTRIETKSEMLRRATSGCMPRRSRPLTGDDLSCTARGPRDGQQRSLRERPTLTDLASRAHRGQ